MCTTGDSTDRRIKKCSLGGREKRKQLSDNVLHVKLWQIHCSSVVLHNISHQDRIFNFLLSYFSLIKLHLSGKGYIFFKSVKIQYTWTENWNCVVNKIEQVISSNLSKFFHFGKVYNYIISISFPRPWSASLFLARGVIVKKVDIMNNVVF